MSSTKVATLFDIVVVLGNASPLTLQKLVKKLQYVTTTVKNLHSRDPERPFLLAMQVAMLELLMHNSVSEVTLKGLTNHYKYKHQDSTNQKALLEIQALLHEQESEE